LSVVKREINESEVRQLSKKYRFYTTIGGIFGCLAVIFGILNYLYESIEICIGAVIFSVFGIATSLGMVKDYRMSLKKAFENGTVLELTGTSPDGFNFYAGEVDAKAYSKLPIQGGERATLVVVPEMHLGLSLNGVPFKKPIVVTVIDKQSNTNSNNMNSIPQNTLQPSQNQFNQGGINQEISKVAKSYPTTSKEITCAKCGKGISDGFLICPYCGNVLKETCKKCGKEIKSDFVICPFCGAQK